MQVLHILNHVRDTGNGIVNVAVDLACVQRDDGHKVAVVSAGGEFDPLLASHQVMHFYLDQRRRPLSLAQALYAYQSILRTSSPEVVHAHMMTGAVLSRALRRAHKFKLVTTVHNEFQRSALLMALGDRVICVSQAVAEAMAKRGVPGNKLRIVRNGPLGSPRTPPLETLRPVPLHRPAIVTVAGLYERKGIVDVIDAYGQIACEFPEVHLYIVGDGPSRASLGRRARATIGAERIHFEGFQTAPQRYLLAADIFVLASHRDPFPLVIPEAREAGTAIVASAVDGIPEALDGGRAGILVPAHDPAALAAALRKILRDPVELDAWRSRAKENTQWLRVLRLHADTLDVYRELISDQEPHVNTC